MPQFTMSTLISIQPKYFFFIFLNFHGSIHLVRITNKNIIFLKIKCQSIYRRIPKDIAYTFSKNPINLIKNRVEIKIHIRSKTAS